MVWSENENPTIEHNMGITFDGTGTGQFTSHITNLNPNTTYYVRAYATNSVGTGYGEVLSFTTLPTPFSVTGGGSYCQGVIPSGISAGLDGSETGVAYQLYRSGQPFGAAVAGTGQPLVWEDLNAGVYTVKATNASGVESWMNGSASVTMYIPVSIANLLAQPNAICTGSAVQLSVVAENGCGPLSFQWSSNPPGFNSTEQNPVVNPQANSWFIVTVSDEFQAVTDSVFVNVFQTQPPGLFTNMLPPDLAILPIPQVTLSWQPCTNTSVYDVYIWKASDPVPVQPVKANLSAIQYTHAGLNFATAYKWKVIAKNPCFETGSNVMNFSIAELPDLVISNIQVPENPFTGQQIEISWTTFNQGNQGTMNKTWFDAVYLSSDAALDPDIDLYLGGMPNPVSLPENTGYSQSLNVTLPVNLHGSMYIIVRTDAYNAVAEAYENNNDNYSAVIIQLTPPPDLQVTSIIIPTIAFSGQTATIE
jgi:hypothetical protein